MKHWKVEQLLQAKKALLIGLIYLKLLNQNLPHFKLNSRVFSHKKMEDNIR